MSGEPPATHPLSTPPSPPPLQPSTSVASAATLARWAWVLGLGLAIGVLAWCARSDYRDAWYAERDATRVLVQLTVYWGCWLLGPLAAWSAWRGWDAWRAGRWTGTVVAAFAVLFYAGLAWSRFVEPQMLSVRETKLGSACGVRVALVSDLHLGLFERESDLRRWATALNGLKVDAVLFAGDWTMEPPRDLVRLLTPLTLVRHRMLSVTGNHDEEGPGPPLTQSLVRALAAVGVESIEARRVPLGRCELVGLGDFHSGSTADHLASLATRPSSVPPSLRVVLAHDPDSTTLLPMNYAAWVLAGHTHGGQVDLPWATDRVLARVTDGAYRQGRYRLPTAQMFITSGLGRSNLPFRFRVPPVIDVLAL